MGARKVGGPKFRFFSIPIPIFVLTLAKPTLTNGVVCCVVCVCGEVLVARFHGVVFGAPEDHPSRGPPFPSTAQNFTLFSLSRRKIRSCLPSLGVLSWNFGGVLKRGALTCARLELSCCRLNPGVWRESEKKFWALPTLRGPTLRGPRLRTPHFLGPWSPTLSTHPRPNN